MLRKSFKNKFFEFKISKTSLKKEGTFDGLNIIISELHMVYFRCYIIIIINDIFHYIACKYSCQFNVKNSMPFFLSLNYFMQPSDCDLFFGCHSTTLNGRTAQNSSRKCIIQSLFKISFIIYRIIDISY